MLSSNKISAWLKKRLEIICWCTALLALFFMPAVDNSPSLCLFRFIGFDHCPGCGIGHSIHYALHLEFTASLQHHIFGLPAVLIIAYRIKQLSFLKLPTR